jgi:predicted transcriptional regulator of viral defense system
MPRDAFAAVYDLASENFGYLTAVQAREDGVSSAAIVMMERRGVLERVSRGVYRLAQFPVSQLAQYMEAVLWPHGTTAVISHDSALALYGISDVDPARIHITLPPQYRVRRAVPRHLAIHSAALAAGERTVHEGIPLTTVERTLFDCRDAGLGGDLLQHALVDAQEKGFISRKSAERLNNELTHTHDDAPST